MVPPARVIDQFLRPIFVTDIHFAMPGVESPPSPDDVVQKLRDLVDNPLQNASALQIRAMALVGRLKSLNRTANTSTRIHKEATSAARQDMDQSHLGLQNLLYEKRHLEREIEKCRQFAYVSRIYRVNLWVLNLSQFYLSRCPIIYPR